MRRGAVVMMVYLGEESGVRRILFDWGRIGWSEHEQPAWDQPLLQKVQSQLTKWTKNNI